MRLQHSTLSRLFLVSATALTLWACDNDDIPFSSSDDEEKVYGSLISFEMSQQGADDSRATTKIANAPLRNSLFRSDDSKDSLYVTAISTEWNDEITDSRGTLITTSSAFNYTVKCVHKKDRASSAYFTQTETYTSTMLKETVETEYYWLGTGHEFEFLAFTPTTLLTDDQLAASSMPPSISYSVPASATDQKDLMIARPLYNSSVNFPGNYNQRVDLEFSHLCTAIQFKMGSDMISGATIKSITINGIYATSSYNVSTGVWSAVGTATQDVSLTTSVTTSNGGTYNPTNLFILPPQDLTDVSVSITYQYGQAEKTVSGSLAGLIDWEAGRRITYTFNISPDLTIGVAALQDAHYSMVEVPFEVVGLSGSNQWTLSSNAPWCTLRSELVGPEEDGYWISNTTTYSEFNRSATVSGTGNGKKSVWLFLEENAGTASRDVTITLSTPSKSVTSVVTQLSPSWTGPNRMGWERIEDTGTYPFGFHWTRVVVYKSTGLLSGVIGVLLEWLGTYGDLVSFSTSFFSSTVTIDYRKANELTNETTSTAGLANTWALYQKAGGAIDAFETTLLNWGYEITSDTGSNEQTDDYAALIALKCNPFTVSKTTSSGTTAYKVKIAEEDIKWFLPAPEQFICGDTDYPMSGSYWSSQADDSPNAFAVMNLGGNPSAAPTPTSQSRDTKYKVRALRIAR